MKIIDILTPHGNEFKILTEILNEIVPESIIVEFKPMPNIMEIKPVKFQKH